MCIDPQSWGIPFLSTQTFLAGAEKPSDIFIEEPPAKTQLAQHIMWRDISSDKITNGFNVINGYKYIQLFFLKWGVTLKYCNPFL